MGHWCPQGSSLPTACPLGTYNPTAGGAYALHCLRCPAGFYCPTAGATAAISTNKCADGHYCPSGTQIRTQFPCPAGTYGNFTYCYTLHFLEATCQWLEICKT
ncbi:hypothetical protein IE077_000906 [Cardiosporidium cionae]|uniref:Uncharacterized protein n=1 Tax=Cardiosporidium cionae TaxID=476202 RepID=A0ABQ7JDW4_9APIC|nr:hypothetical protein IE077_000906 [Cardiosporidium cionae]|eukprot:KAF8822161.1 hypothetical protein IE077_000906 [Cardiosporidium cionae]